MDWITTSNNELFPNIIMGWYIIQQTCTKFGGDVTIWLIWYLAGGGSNRIGFAELYIGMIQGCYFELLWEVHHSDLVVTANIVCIHA